MHKKLFAACLVIAAFAVVPSLASAKPVITHPTGSILATGTKITATNVGNTIMTTPIGNITCTTAILTGELTQNNTANGIRGTITSAKFGGTGSMIVGDDEPECTGSGFVGNTGITATPPYCVEAVEANDNLKVRGGACSEATKNIVFKMTVTGPFGIKINCSYSKASMSGTARTETETILDGAAIFGEQEFKKSEGGGECPESGKLDMTFTMETDVVVATPIYISP